ncbi:MAG: mechanosensitive ion channel family protein [Desulfurococcales archaeon]|nr:mechanosensitive ion channel family protein [Desulfurococcales archaeon]
MPSLNDILGQQIPLTSITLGNVLWAVIIAIVGYIIIVVVRAVFRKTTSTIGLPPLVSGIIEKFLAAILYTSLILAIAGALGFSTGSIILGLSAVIGLILGFGLQDALNNLAAGVMIAVSRPFERGDLVSIAGHIGVVEEVGILSTVITKFDNEIAIIPNRNVWGSVIVNYTKNPIRRISFTVGVAYGTDLDYAIKTALETVKCIDGVLEDPAPQVVVTELADSSVNLSIRLWAKKEDYGRVREEAIKRIYRVFAEKNIEIPFPQLEVHLKGEGK